MEDFGFPLIGDIIFVTSKGKAGWANRAGQRLTTTSKVKFHDIPSHVAICSGGVFIQHAVTSGGSKISSVNEFFNQRKYKDNIRVFRNLELERKISAGFHSEDFLVDKIEKHWGEAYNYGVLTKRAGANKKFCSEIVTIFLQDIEVLNSPRVPSKTYPIHLFEICQDVGKWKEVTVAYKALNSFPFMVKQMAQHKTQTDSKEIHDEIDGMTVELLLASATQQNLSSEAAEMKQMFKPVFKKYEELDKKVAAIHKEALEKLKK